MSSPEKFHILEQELKTYIKPLGEASDIIVNEGVSKYPIFVVHQQDVHIGIPVIDKNKTSGNWSVNASSLEEFVAKQIVAEIKVEDFKKEYKTPEDFLCVFSLSELGAKFIFIRRTAI